MFKWATWVTLLALSGFLPALCCAQTSSPTVPPAADCLPHYVAPTGVYGKSVSTRSDTGVATLRFLELSVFNQLVQTISGVDLASVSIDETQTKIDMPKLKRCGADFAFIRLSGRDNYTTLPPNSKLKTLPVWQMWNEALAANIEVYPYHFLYPSKDVMDGKVGSGFPYSEEGKKVLTERMEADGHAQADEFIKAYSDSHLQRQPKSKIGFPQYIALDIEVPLTKRFATDRQNGEANRFNYSVGYGYMACAWITDVEKSFPNAKIIIYTDIQMDSEYSVMNVDYTGPRCLRNYDVWLALPTAHGGHFAEDTQTAGLRTTARKFCFAANPSHDRCTFHQYTQRANIALVDLRRKKSTPLHLDLNRYHVGKIPWELMPTTPPKGVAKKPSR